MPLVPQVNIDSSNIQATAAFLKELGKEAAQLELIPYHRLGMPKYEILGKSYPMKGVTPLKPNDIETIRRAFEKLGVYCTVSR
jgi:pyruvate formate lyase activating enzyme